MGMSRRWNYFIDSESLESFLLALGLLLFPCFFLLFLPLEVLLLCLTPVESSSLIFARERGERGAVAGVTVMGVVDNGGIAVGRDVLLLVNIGADTSSEELHVSFANLDNVISGFGIANYSLISPLCDFLNNPVVFFLPHVFFLGVEVLQ